MSTRTPLRYLICYDVPEDRRRTRIAKHLDAFGDRVQFSVFEALLDGPLFERLESGLLELLDPAEDLVSIYTLCGACNDRVRRLGRDSDRTPPGEEVTFVV